ncbi:MAG: hypothetical protein ACUVTP_10580 [Candidatus Fervidibacter sp.]
MKALTFIGMGKLKKMNLKELPTKKLPTAGRGGNAQQTYSQKQ